MEQFIQNMLIGIRQWVNEKIADMNEAIGNKQDILTAGDNIEITSGGTISVTGITNPVASDFDVKDLADSTGLRTEWSGKQDALTAGDNIDIDSAGTISATGMTSATETALEEMSYVISSNINELDGRLTSVESGKQDVLTEGSGIDIDSSNTISVSSEIISGAAAGATALQPGDIASWAKQPNKPTYTAQEVGAMPADTVIIDDSDVASGTTFSSSKIVDLLGSISQFTVRIVQALPASGETHVIYFVPAVSGETSGSTDVMDEYMWVEHQGGEYGWEMIGSTRIDLSDYYTVSEVNNLLDAKQDIPVISVQDVLDVLNEEEVYEEVAE